MNYLNLLTANVCVKRYLLLLTFAFMVIGVQAQEIEKTIFNIPSENGITNLEIDLSSYNMNQVGQLKDELSAFKEKVIVVELNQTGVLVVEYNEKMLLQDLMKTFENNRISYLSKDYRKPKKELVK